MSNWVPSLLCTLSHGSKWAAKWHNASGKHEVFDFKVNLGIWGARRTDVHHIGVLWCASLCMILVINLWTLPQATTQNGGYSARLSAFSYPSYPPPSYSTEWELLCQAQCLLIPSLKLQYRMVAALPDWVPSHTFLPATIQNGSRSARLSAFSYPSYPPSSYNTEW